MSDLQFNDRPDKDTKRSDPMKIVDGYVSYITEEAPVMEENPAGLSRDQLDPRISLMRWPLVELILEVVGDLWYMKFRWTSEPLDPSAWDVYVDSPWGTDTIHVYDGSVRRIAEEN